MYLIGQVEMCGRLLPAPEILTYASFFNEAIASSTIEGTIASPEELIRYQAGIKPERLQVIEVANYQNALRTGVDMLATRPITLNLILKLHEILLEGVRGSTAAGRWKQHQNHVGWDIEKKAPIYTPPPPNLTQDLMSHLELYIHSDAPEAKLVQVALVHYQFETIHPFGDGNGRIGRLLIVLQLLQLKMISSPLIYPSAYFERTKDRYINGLQNVRESGEWVSWIDYFVEAITNQSKATVEVAKLLLTLQRDLKQSVHHIKSHASVSRVLESFFRSPVLTVSDVCNQAGIARNTAKSALAILHEMGLLSAIEGSRNSKIYICSPIFDALVPKRQQDSMVNP